MSLTEISTTTVIKKQYFFKIKAFMNIFYGLIGMQLIAILFSLLTGVSSESSGNNDIHFTARRYSGDLIMFMTFVWAFVFAISYASKTYRNVDFAFISNRFSSNLSNIGFLITVGIAGGVTTSLTSALLRVVMYFLIGSNNISYENFFIPPQDLVLNIIAIAMYIILFTSIGYLFGVLTQLSRLFVVLLPTIIIGSVFIESTKGSQLKVLSKIIGFFVNESSLLMFMVKIIIIVTILFGIGILISNETEVR
jgi:hypothetical protein